ncbi:hypothetical protein JXJ21_15415 [candidate division KSB1 bacterium]|nr:hypothetical protein [candidate division KSB1 bacterium]
MLEFLIEIFVFVLFGGIIGFIFGWFMKDALAVQTIARIEEEFLLKLHLKNRELKELHRMIEHDEAQTRWMREYIEREEQVNAMLRDSVDAGKSENDC